MNPTDYISNALLTKSSHFDPNSVDPDLIHAIFGLVTESGELMDIVKRAFFYGKGKEAVDLVHVKEEIQDILWYVALACNNLGVSFEEMMDKNIAKLRARYPNKFNTEDAYNRDLEGERKVLT